MSNPAQNPTVLNRGKKKRKKFIKSAIVWAVTLAVLGAGGWLLVRFLNSGTNATGEIYSTQAHIGTIQSKVSGSGVARSKESAAMTLSQSGLVREVKVKQGDTVTEGQPLYTVFSQDAQDVLDAARETLKRANRAMEDLQEIAAELTIRAPFTGKLIDVKTFEPEQQVSIGESIATIVNDRKMKVSLYFSYAYEDLCYVGQKATVSVPAVMNNFPGTVESINKVSYISPEGGTHFEVVIVFDNPGTLTAEMAASAVLQSVEGEVYPYADGKLAYYETRTVLSKSTGPVETLGNLLNYADVKEGEMLVQLGSETVDDQIADQEELVADAKTALEAAEKDFAVFNGTAPINGTVTSCTLVEGAEVKNGETVLIITNNTNMLVTINVDDRNIAFVRPGNIVELNWNGQPYVGTVTSIDMGGAQQGTGMTNYPVTLSVENHGGQLMDGAWLQYSFVTSESADCVLVPSSAVQYFADKEGKRQSVVFVRRDTRPDDVPELDLPAVEPGRKRRFPTEEEGYYPVIVETGLSDAQNVEIVSGVSVDDEVFVNFTVVDNSGSW